VNKKYYSPAKINLFFRVLNKRLDGYHDIFSVLQAVNIFDVLQMEAKEEDLFICTDPSIANSNNLVLKALKVFRRETGIEDPLSIHLEKHIPMEGGLGGGSSNAATMLWALNEFFATSIPIDTLMMWGGSLGSDVPFFFSKGRAICLGRGEIVKDILPIKKKFSFWIAKPDFGVSTKEVYEKFDDLDILPGQINQLEQSAFAVMPKLAMVKKQLLDNGFRRVVMTGSGSGFYCFGNPQNMHMEGITLYPVENIDRPFDQWYQPCSVVNDSAARVL